MLLNCTGPAVQIIRFNLTKSMECGILLLKIMALTSCLFYRQALSCRYWFKPDLRYIEALYFTNTYVLFISDICEQLAYEWRLLTYPPSDHDRQYYSKWIQFVPPHATRPTYTLLDSQQEMQQNMQK